AMSESAARFKQLFILALCKIPALYIYALVTPEEQVWILLLSLSFGAAEAVLGFLAFKNLFDSLDHLGNSERDHGIFEKLSQVKLATLIFTVAKPVFAVLPDLTLLADDRYGTVTGVGIQSLRSYRTIFNVIAFVAVLILGIVWLVMAIRYFRSVKRERAFFAEIEEKMAQYYREDTKLVFRYLITVCSFLLYACFFCLELKIEGYSMLPPMINAALFVITAALLYRHYRGSTCDKTAKTSLIAACGYFVTALVGYILSARFTARHYNDEIGGGFAEEMQYYITRDFEIFDELLLANIFVALSQVAFVVMTVALVRMIHRLIESHCGTPESSLQEKDKTAAFLAREAYADKTIKTSLHKGTVPFLIVSVLTALSSAVFPLLEIYVNLFFTVDLLIRILYVVLSTAYITKLRQGIKVKAALDFE
ncbi:MAG: hypothetical protein IJW46_04620, partial [Clostridia bacterium]|nr:hypothetical protein [Clostridia bacterium]